MPKPDTETLRQQCDAVWVQCLVCLLLLVRSSTIRETLLPELPGQCMCLMLGLTTEVLHQHYLAAKAWQCELQV